MSAAYRTRDGSFSPVAAALAIEDAKLGFIEVSHEEALSWAQQNRVALVAGEPADNRLRRINAARREFELPLFALAGPAGAAILRSSAPQVQDRHGVAGPKDPGSIRSPVQERQPAAGEHVMVGNSHDAALPPLCASQDELLELVTGFDGTRTGLVTPEIAGWLLDLNTANRPLQKGAVHRFVQILKAGLWQLTGEAVIVSREGQLNDGQHRLHAIMAASMPAPLDVRFGIAREAFAATGTGTRRTASQAVAITGAKNASAQAAIARLLVHHDAGQMAKASLQVEPQLVLETIQAEPLIAEIAAMTSRHRFAPARTAPFSLILLLAARATTMEKVAAFAAVVNSGRAAAETDPAYQLHLRLRDAALRKERLSQVDVAALAVRAWNAWIQGRELHRLVIQDGDRTSENFPEVMGA